MTRQISSATRRRSISAAATPLILGHLDRDTTDRAIDRVLRSLDANGIVATVYGPRGIKR
jgi:hypothetical protein